MILHKKIIGKANDYQFSLKNAIRINLFILFLLQMSHWFDFLYVIINEPTKFTNSMLTQVRSSR